MFFRELNAAAPRTIVLVHGQLFDGAVFDGVTATLAGQFRVLVPDLPGYGRSPLDGAAGVADVQDRLGRELRARVKGPLVLVGFSLGAYHALALLTRGLLAPAGLALLAPVVGLSDDKRAQFRQNLAACQAAPGAVADVIASIMHAPAFLAGRPDRAAATRARFTATAMDTITWDLQAALDMPDLSPQLGSVAVPVLVRVGALDQAVPPALGRAIAAALPHAQLRECAGVGHLQMIEDPAGLAEDLSRFAGSVLP
ncbi:MAG: alpha/beta hydrolase [Deltaproteobacteria bacterium]|nr:alpha/beta hydrolase [Deltaproteobacteria bacterium]